MTDVGSDATRGVPPHPQGEWFRALAEQSPNIFYALRTDPDRAFEFMSENVLSLLGYPASEFVAVPGFIEAVIDPRDMQLLAGLIATAPDIDSEGELRWIGSDGQTVWTQIWARKRVRADGSSVIEGIAHDITSLRIEQQHREKAEERYRLVASTTASFLEQTSAGRVIEWVSDTVTPVLGWQPEEMVGHSVDDFLHPDDRSRAAQQAAELDGRERAQVRYRMRCADGSFRWMGQYGRPVFDEAGGLDHWISGWRDVQAEVDAQVALEESQSRYRALAENASDVVLLRDPTGTIQWVSPSVTGLLGWDPDEMVGRDTIAYVHPDDVVRILDMRAEVASGRPAAGVLARIRAADGATRFMTIVSKAIIDDDGVQTGAVVGLRDVDELVHQRELAELEAARRSAVVATLIDPHVLLAGVRDEGGRIIDFTYVEANDAACADHGRSREELIGHRMSVLLPGERDAGMIEEYASVLETGAPLLIDEISLPDEARSGHARVYDLRAVRVGDYISITWRDVTDRSRAAEALAESEEHFRLLAENSLDVIVQLRQGEVRWVSPSLETTLGWRPADWVGCRIDDFVHPDDLEAFEGNRDTLYSGQPVVNRYRLRARDTAFHWVESHAHPYFDAEGSPEGVVGSFRVVDDEVAAAQELERRARYDDLTGVIKREEALSRLVEMGRGLRAPGRESGVLFIDVDEFKAVNDSHGHLAGDAVLRTLATRIKDVIRGGDTVARMGGDEFLVLLDGIHDLAEALAVAEKIRQAASHPIHAPRGSVRVTTSIGVTLRKRDDHVDALIARADEAMYRAKQAGRNQVVAL